LDEHLFDYHLVKKYADLLNITPKHLNEITKERTQKTPSELIAEKRILEAQRQLLYSSQTISEIAHQLGFSSPSHFGTFFKKNVGFTPDQYRTEKVTDI
jgi:AraC-like DNA-binding protein